MQTLSCLFQKIVKIKYTFLKKGVVSKGCYEKNKMKPQKIKIPNLIAAGIFLLLWCGLSYAAEPPEGYSPEKDAMSMAKYMETLFADGSSLVKSIEESSDTKAKTLLGMAREKKKAADQEINQKKYADAIVSFQSSYNYLMDAVKIVTAKSREEKWLIDEVEESKVSADFYIIRLEKGVKDTKNAEAFKLLQDAKTARTKAKENIKASDYKEALKNLDASISFSRHAISLVTKEGETRDDALKEREKKDIERKEARYRDAIKRKTIEVETLITAAERLTRNEDNDEAGKLLKSAVEKRKTAFMYADKNEYGNALENLRESYSLAAQSIIKMRQGKVVTHTVIFENTRDEFIYEKDRNEMYFLMLSFFSNKENTEVQKLIEDAKAMKEKAEDAAVRDDYAEALNSIETSTNLVVKALGMLGFKQ